MVGSEKEVNQGSGAGSRDGVHGCKQPEESCPEADRASVRARKRGNARGAKGGRAVMATQAVTGTTPAGVVPSGLCAPAGKPFLQDGGWKPTAERKLEKRRALPATFSFRGPMEGSQEPELVHGLESRMREIRPSGSGGGVGSRIPIPTLSKAFGSSNGYVIV